MPVRGTKQKAAPEPTKQPFVAVNPQAAPAYPSTAPDIPSISTHDFGYFFDVATAIYQQNGATTSGSSASGLPSYDDSTTNKPESLLINHMSSKAVLVLGLFRQTLTHIRPVAERFHFGPADRQPLYALTAQPSPRSADEFNELIIKRRDPRNGVWYAACTADIEPKLDPTRPGHYKIASLTMDAVPVWKRVTAGQVNFETAESRKGNELRLWWGDRATLGAIGDAYSPHQQIVQDPATQKCAY